MTRDVDFTIPLIELGDFPLSTNLATQMAEDHLRPMSENQQLPELSLQPAVAKRPVRQRRWRHWAGVLLILVLIVAVWRMKFVAYLVLPPMRDETAVFASNSIDFSMSVPSGWDYYGIPERNDRLACVQAWKHLTRGTQNLEVIRGPATRLDDMAAQKGKTDVNFQGKPAVLLGNVQDVGVSLLHRIRMTLGGNSLPYWTPRHTIAIWQLGFERHGQQFRITYAAPCVANARIDTTSIPPEVMSYFETFEYTPVADALPGVPATPRTNQD